MGGNNGGKRGKGCQGTCIKDTWTKPKGCRRKMETTVLKQQFKKFKRKKIKNKKQKQKKNNVT